MTRKFQNREDAGRQLADRLRDQISIGKTNARILVYAIPTGGVPVAKAIADALGADMDIAPHMQAPAVDALENTSTASAEFSSVVKDRKSDDFLNPKDHEVILVDDVIRTGRTQQMAIRLLRERGASRIVVAAIVSTEEARRLLKEEDCEFVVLGSARAESTDDDFFDEASSVTSQDVFDIRERARRFPAGAQSSSTVTPQKVHLNFEGERLRAGLSIPVEAQGLVLFACSNESSREGMLTQAKELNEMKLATLVLDDVKKDATSRSLRKTIEWLSENRETSLLPVAIVAKGESVAAALDAAAATPEKMRCLVLIDGQIESAGNVLPYVQSPTLVVLRIGDEKAAAATRGLLDTMTTDKVLVMVEDGEFEEEVERTMKSWLERYLLPVRPSRGAASAQETSVRSN